MLNALRVPHCFSIAARRHRLLATLSSWLPEAGFATDVSCLVSGLCIPRVWGVSSRPMNETPCPVKNERKAAAGRKGGQMRQATNRETIQATRMRQAFELRRAGLTFVEIAPKIGLSESQIRALYKRAMQQFLGDTANLAEEIRHKQLVKLTFFENKIFSLAEAKSLKVQGTSKDGIVMQMEDFEALPKLSACLVRNYERQAQLVGADMPTRIKTTAPNAISLADLLRIAEGSTAPTVSITEIPAG